MDISKRFKEERERLCFSQAAFAELGGATKWSLINWEAGRQTPNGAYLAAIAAHGADVLYILTGQRSQIISPQALLPEGDRILLDNYHAAPAGVQAGVKTTLGAFSAQTGKPKRKAA